MKLNVKILSFLCKCVSHHVNEKCYFPMGRGARGQFATLSLANGISNVVYLMGNFQCTHIYLRIWFDLRASNSKVIIKKVYKY